ncbi:MULTISPECIES: leucyl aminopeptidase [unclassified Roseitalea]|uniref:leucyl aminopeptidase n=1 Tax=unclassified Roseitalea TaxID=2639107 RepID=UPI0027402D62|nr:MULTISPECIES: leucyl aminopeptidase [unclassified Roseitalea]
MSILPTVSFAKPTAIKKGAVVIVSPQDAELSGLAGDVDGDGVLDRAARIAEFKGKKKALLDVLAPSGSPASRILAIGAGKVDELTRSDWQALGGAARKALAKESFVTVIGGEAMDADAATAFGQGWMLRAYDFDKYKTVKSGDNDDNGKADPKKAQKVTIQIAGAAEAKKGWEGAEAVARGVMLARDLVNEPANLLGPVEFAGRTEALGALGVEVDTLDEKQMKKLGMGAFLGVAQGSARPPRIVIMKWNGAGARHKPVAFIGKGVVFDTGGISIKPSGGMEDMKGDMGGAAAVTGLMHALAGRKAKVNAIGIVGLVENMPDGNAQRPGDIVTSMSGQTIEVINTDAEGRLILADMLTYCKKTYEPRSMINLATLTGAIIVALGQEHAGLFTNDDAIAEALSKAGMATGEKVWRMPLGPEYDKMIDSKFADMKNVGGRNAGSITAAQFLKRFVGDTPWAHLDVAGTAMASPANDVNASWGSGFGVRLLDEWVRAVHESPQAGR